MIELSMAVGLNLAASTAAYFFIGRHAYRSVRMMLTARRQLNAERAAFIVLVATVIDLRDVLVTDAQIPAYPSQKLQAAMARMDEAEHHFRVIRDGDTPAADSVRS